MSGRSNPMLDRRALFSSAAAAALLAASGVSASGLPRSGGRLRMALSGAARSDDWRHGSGLFMQVARQGIVFDTLTEVAADGTLRPELATGWVASENARIWTFELRKDVSFHDGSPCAACDVVGSLEPMLGQQAEVSALTSHSIRIVLDKPDAGLPLLLSGPDFVIRPADAPDDGIGTGLYRIRRFAAGQQLLTERVAAHWKDGTAGWFDEVELVSIPAEAVRAQALTEGLVDAVDQEAGHAVAPAVALPGRVGRERPFDNLRAAERWWFG
jgi:ABC-type transport system substrate-binding protein